MHLRFARMAAPLIALALAAACGGLAEDCNQVQTAIVTTSSTGSGCTSPVGVCTQGTTSSGELAGTTQFFAASMGPGPDANSIVYTGQLVITTPSGSITFHDHGLLNSTSGAYLEIQEVASGTGTYVGAHGMLTSAGSSTSTGFQGDLNGSICTFPSLQRYR